MNHKEILESGLLELYAVGLLAGEERVRMEELLASDPVLKQELEVIEETLFEVAQANAVDPNPTVKPLLMAKLEYRDRLQNGEIPESPPALNTDSKIEQFQRWLDREDMQLRPDFTEAQVAIIADEPEKMTAIVWLKSGAPPETHITEHEKFLIVEGTCDLTIGTNVNHLKPGDYLSIPLHISHHVLVTSEEPCKIILQRVKMV